SIALAVRELLVGGAVERYLVGWIVLAVAFGAEGISLLQSLALTRREAALWGESTQSFLRHTSEPTLRAIVVEDTAALIGLIVAAAVHPAPGQTADELAIALDDIDHAMRQELPEVAEVFIDLTSHRAGSAEGQPGSAQQTEDGGLYDESMTPLPPGTPAPDFEL